MTVSFVLCTDVLLVDDDCIFRVVFSIGLFVLCRVDSDSEFKFKPWTVCSVEWVPTVVYVCRKGRRREVSSIVSTSFTPAGTIHSLIH